MKVSIAGTGYVGLVSGVCLAQSGHEVTCVDLDESKVRQINQGIPPIHEADLEKLLRRNLNKTFRATTNLREAVLDSEITMIAVGTPFAGDEIDLRYIKEAALQIGSVLKEKTSYHVVVVKSTVVPGTTDGLVLEALEKSSEKKAGVDFGLGMNPEFLREGEAVQDFMEPDRIVWGALDERSGESLARLYEAFPHVERICTNLRTAETIKYTANALLATMISFSNEIGNLCAAIGNVDVVEVMQGVHLDKRLSPIPAVGQRIVPVFTTYLEAGCGFGGSCFPKDVKALISYGKKKGRPMRLLDAVIDVNSTQPRTMLTILRKHFPILEGVKVTVLGLAFKPGTDDMRESPAIPIVRELLAQKAQVKAFDPVAKHEAGKLFGPERLSFADNLAEAVGDAQAILILTRWPEFKGLPELLQRCPDQPLVIDGRRLLDKRSIAKYEGIGLS